MGTKTIYECDICHTEKKDSNHWYLGRIQDMFSEAENQSFHMLQIVPFDLSMAHNWIILCGEACVHKFISQNLATLHPPKEAPIEDHYREVGLG